MNLINLAQKTNLNLGGIFMFKRVTFSTLFILFGLMMIAHPVFAQPEIISGARNLAQDLLNWILVLIPITGGVMLAYHAWVKQMSDGDPGTVAERNKKMKNVLIASIIGVSAAGIIRIILGYF